MQKTYAKMQAECGIKVGYTVKVLREAKRYEMEWDNEWVQAMDDFIGKRCKVVRVDKLYGIEIKSMETDDSWSFPFFVLEKINIFDPSYRPEPFTHVLCRNGNDYDFEPDIFRFYDDNDPLFPYDCMLNEWQQCIPYEGNEHLVKKER